MVICLEQGADLHMAQMMSLPLTVSCFSKIQIGFTLLVPADLGSPGKRAVKRVCVCVCVCVLLNAVDGAVRCCFPRVRAQEGPVSSCVRSRDCSALATSSLASHSECSSARSTFAMAPSPTIPSSRESTQLSLQLSSTLLLLVILYGHVLCRKFSCSLSFFSMF